MPEKEIISVFTQTKEKTVKTIVCTPGMKGVPYSFWRKVLERIYNLADLSEKALDEVYRYQIALEDRNNFIRYVINQQELKNSNPAQVHEEIAKTIFNLIRNQVNIVFYVKNFENMDETSKVICEQFMNNFDSLPLS